MKAYTLRTSGESGAQLEFDFGPEFDCLNSETKVETEFYNKLTKSHSSKPVSMKPQENTDEI